MTRYIRYSTGSRTSYGILDGETVHALPEGLFDSLIPTGVTHHLSSVTLLAPIEPGKILAVGRNYKSHLGTRPQPETPEMFYKPVSRCRIPAAPS